MKATVEDYRQCYRTVFASYLAEPSEESLRDAYELGRGAVRQGLSVLDLAAVHHDVLAETHGHASDVADAAHATTLAGQFFLESLSAYELVQRGLREAQEKVLIERRHTAIVRQLSSFLADSSLALDASDSLTEVLQLVADHARELTGAARCAATAEAPGLRGQPIEVFAADDDFDVQTVHELAALHEALQPENGLVRMTAVELEADPIRAAMYGGNVAPPRVRNWLAASLRALDGRDIGLIQVLDKPTGSFSDLDEAVLVQLAQMASASVERALLYGARSAAAESA